MSKDSVGKVVLVAVALCVVCSVLVSVAAVGLRDLQAANEQLSKQRNVLVAMGAIGQSDRPSREKIEELFSSIERYAVDLEAGTETKLDDESAFEAKDVQIPAGLDLAGIQSRPDKIIVYKAMKGDKVESLVLPVSGKGLWSTLEGFLALESDLRSVRGLVFYAHKETPGLGGEVDNPNWLKQWPGKKVRDADGKYDFAVLKGQGNKTTEHQADGITGATITVRGVDNTIKYWIGSEHGYAKYLARLAAQF